MSAQLSRDDWKGRVGGLSYRNQAFIGGKFAPSLTGKTFDCINPATGQVLTKVAACEQADVDAAVKAARAAFEKGTWANMPPANRKRIMLKLAELMMKNRDELALLETLDMGKPIVYSTRVDIPGSANTVQWFAEAIDKIYDEVAPTPGNVVAMITREAAGVVACVVPWNFPLLMACWKISPALAAGNSVILKPAEQSPLTAIRLAELAAEAGIPEGVFNVLPGFGETAGQALGRHMDVDVLAFTGSTEVGKYFLRYSGESNMKQVWLECGGKSPNIVLGDAPNLDVAARRTAFGIWFNQGEVCTAGSRLIVEEKIKDEFLEKVMAIGQKMMPGDPLDPKTQMGAMVDEVQTKANAIVHMLDDVRVNLETLGEQKAVVDHVAERVAQLDFALQEARNTQRTLQHERELADVGKVFAVHGAAGVDLRAFFRFAVLTGAVKVLQRETGRIHPGMA